MPKINSAIPPRAFEVIRDRIGAILADELDNQFLYTYEPVLEKIKVWTERTRPFDKTELPAIAISLQEGKFENKHQGYADGENTFNIDIYTNSKSKNPEERGDHDSVVMAQWLAGLVWTILESPVYNTLGLAQPSIGRSMVEGFMMADRHQLELFRIHNDDAQYTSICRVLFTVCANEEAEFKGVVMLNGFETKAKLGQTEKGWAYSSD